ncbi:hypothetical protein ACIPM0_15915 [Pseudomonas sichuanensis]|uniref:hypothetical protein n=1 Tax=Pseudomonas sichuanensis TaxID=2213015 RepID=UPI003828925A
MVIRLSDFKKETTQQAEELPSWVRTDTIKKLYLAAIDIHMKIKADIENKKDLSPRERQIAFRAVALKCNMSPSILHPRRQPELVHYIDELNQSLTHTLTSTQAKTHSSGRKLTKDELIKENRLLKEEISRLSNITLADSFNQAIENLLIQESRQAALNIKNLRQKIRELEEIISTQAEQNRRYMDLVSTKVDPS